MLVVNEEINQLIKLTSVGKYDRAYEVGKLLFDTNNNNQEVLDALYSLSDKLRNEAMSFASKKMNYAATSQFETLLKKVNVLTRQDMYGRFL